jgi:AsmA protein
MLEWSKTDIAPGAAIGSVSIASKIQGTSERLRLDTAELNLGGNAGRGVLDISFAEALPSISGTLAFDTLDLRSFLSAFTRLATGQGNIYDQIDTAFAEQLSLDLRLSANNATLGGLALTSLAASTQVKGTLAVFDISDATVFDGSLQAGVRIDTAEETKTVEMRALATDIDSFALAKTLGGERLLPQGRATISATLKGTGRDWNTVMGNAEGSVNATLGQGALVGLNLAQFKEKWATGGFFPLSDVSDGELPLRGVDFKATVLGGIARIDKGDLLLDGQVASISGFIPYFGRALALSGSLAPMGADGERGDPDARFFIGGGWDRPFISPALPTTHFE